MLFFVMWKDVKVAILYGNEEDVKYKILFENLSQALKEGLIVKSILQCNCKGLMPEWISNRIPKNEPNKFEYLSKTEGRLETDHIWFQAI